METFNVFQIFNNKSGMSKFLRNSYYLLLTLIIILIIIYFKNPYATNWLRDFSLNLMTEIIGILLVVILIDRAINIKNENERKKRQEIAFRQLRIPLLNHFTLLFNIFKSSIQEKPDKDYKNVSDLFDDIFFYQITFFDFSKPAPVIPETNWFNYLSQKCLEFKDDLNRTVDKYSFYLEPETVDLMEEIINSPFISFIPQVRRIPELDIRNGYKREYNLFGGEGMIDLIKEYARLFTKLIDCYNLNVLDEKQIIMTDVLWRNDTSPKIGSSRLQND